MNWILLLKGVLCVGLIKCVISFEVSIEPRNVHIKASVVSNVTIMCYADEPLNGCQFKVFENRYKREMPILDLNEENVTDTVKAAMMPKLFGRISGYEYAGTGLKNGQCGINLNVTSSGGDKNWIVGCRVRSSRGGAWFYAEMSVYGNDQKTFQITRPPSRFIALPGETIEVMFKGEEVLTYCHFQLPITGLDVNFDKGLDSAATSLYHYHGESLAAGECGIIIHRVTEQRNGWLQIVYRTKTDTLEWINTAIIVANPPNAVELEIRTTNMTDNSTLIAACTARNSRPVSKISWFIGDTLIRQDAVDDLPDDDWRWVHELQSITQVLQWKVTADDHNKDLKCMVEHVSLNYAMLARKAIKLNSSYSMDSTEYEFFPDVGYYKLHIEGKTWEEAKAVCALENAHLVIINSEAESGVIQQMFRRFPCLGGPNVAALVGFHDQNNEGQFMTIFGDSLASTGFTRWSTIGKQPDNAPPGEDCGSVHRNGALNDFGCDKKTPFFCEKDLYVGSDGNKYDSGYTVTGDGPKKPKTRLIDARLDGEIEDVDSVENAIFVFDDPPSK